ncbi:sensor histidine kinase [Phocaeicola massiliensis]|uniref:sensor histidine kinase n=1 Tax=Phocaeicola massiliensis TaxID=204516 RepID=UPI000E41376D|nr:HAMP domain-containing sensor histidine kinase [Phocaeicola massiliensis]RGF00136.1 sensor histidine kinase [Bacteroides sp. AM22-3LB]
MIKTKYLKIITAISLTSILALQLMWLCNTYILIRNNISEEINQILYTGMEDEAITRLNKTPKGTNIKGEAATDSIPEITYLEEGLYNLGYYISIEDVDSIASTLLLEHKISSDFILNLINPKTGEVLQQSKKGNFCLWNAIHSKEIPIRTDLSQTVQMILVNPHWSIFARMGILLLSTAVMVVFAFIGLFYQIKIIITERKIARLKEDFSYAMIHDMKTPISSAIMCTSRLHSGKLDDKPEIKNHYFTIVENELEHLLALSNKVLTLAKLEQHKLEMNKKEVPLSPMIKDLIEKFTIKTEKTIHFTTDLKTEKVYADEEFLKEAISNLIDNAIKYSKESVKINISSSSDANHDIINIYDNGIGIPQKDQKKIFEKFERASAIKQTRKGGPSGFGLGLNYVYQVMEAHEGRVYINSIEGEFSEFSLLIPKIIESYD